MRMTRNKWLFGPKKLVTTLVFSLLFCSISTKIVIADADYDYFKLVLSGEYDKADTLFELSDISDREIFTKLIAQASLNLNGRVDVTEKGLIGFSEYYRNTIAKKLNKKPTWPTAFLSLKFCGFVFKDIANVPAWGDKHSSNLSKIVRLVNNKKVIEKRLKVIDRVADQMVRDGINLKDLRFIQATDVIESCNAYFMDMWDIDLYVSYYNIEFGHYFRNKKTDRTITPELYLSEYNDHLLSIFKIFKKLGLVDGIQSADFSPGKVTSNSTATANPIIMAIRHRNYPLAEWLLENGYEWPKNNHISSHKISIDIEKSGPRIKRMAGSIYGSTDNWGGLRSYLYSNATHHAKAYKNEDGKARYGNKERVERLLEFVAFSAKQGENLSNKTELKRGMKYSNGSKNFLELIPLIKNCAASPDSCLNRIK